MVELFARGYHAHDDQLGALLYYEYQDVPLLHGLGYHNRAAQQANLLFLSPAAEPFPDVKGSGVCVRSQKRLPTPFPRGTRPPCPPSDCRCWGRDADPQRRHFDKLTFRVAEDEPVDLTVEDLRLSGPKGELPLDDFRGRRRWHGGRQELVAGSVPGRAALRAQLRGGTSFLWCDGLDTTFSLRDYDHFKFTWKIEGVEEGWSNSLIFRVDQSPTDFHVVLRPLGAEITAAAAASPRRRPVRPISRRGLVHRRHAAVAADGAVGRGAAGGLRPLAAGPAADGWQAGPLWHLRAMPQSGANWYNASGPEELLVWFGPSPGRTCGVETVALWSGRKPPAVFAPFTVFAKETLKAGSAGAVRQRVGAASAADAGCGLGRGIRAVSGPDGAVTVELPGRGEGVRVGLAPDGTWNVSHPELEARS